MMIIQLSADSNMDPSGSDMTVLSMAIGQMHCLVCNADLSVSGSWSSNIFDTKAKTHSRSLTLNKAMSDIIGEEISQNSIHSNTICQKCLQSVNEIDDLEDQLAALKKRLNKSYNHSLDGKTSDLFVKVKEEPQSDDSLSDNSYYENDVDEYEEDEDGDDCYDEDEDNEQCYTMIRRHSTTLFRCNKCGKDFFTMFHFSKHHKIHENSPNEIIFKVKKEESDEDEDAIRYGSSPSIVLSEETFNNNEEADIVKIFIRAPKMARRKRSKQETFACVECNKIYHKKGQYEAHVRSHLGLKPFGCGFCSKAFNQRSNLWSHIKATHLNERKFKCDFCNKAFKRRRQLNQHRMSAHTGERPFQCSRCPAAFVNKQHFQKHERIHTGEKPYECKVCHKRFNSTGNLFTHKFVHSEKKPYECRICQCGFMRKNHIRTHLQEHDVDILDEYIQYNPPDVGLSQIRPSPVVMIMQPDENDQEIEEASENLILACTADYGEDCVGATEYIIPF